MIINRDCSVEGAHWRVFPLPVFSGYRVVARYDVVGISGFRVAPGHPAQRCGVQWRGRKGQVPLPVFPARVFLDSASHRVTPHHDAGSRKVPLVGIAFAGISGFRIKCGMTGSTAS